MSSKFNIILFMCNWGPHTAFQDLQDNAIQLPEEIKMIRIPCSGRINKGLLFKAFEKGADGVALIGCSSGSCRYGSGTETAQKNIEETRTILDLLGLNQNRLQNVNFSPDDSDLLLDYLYAFSKEIREIGPTPIERAELAMPETSDEEILTEIIQKYDIYSCQDCGKCTSTCPIALTGKTFSPRAIANAVIDRDLESDAVTRDLWSCLTCGLCYDRCPSAVRFNEFVRDIRNFMAVHNYGDRIAHGGFFQSLMRAMTSPELKTQRWKWLPDDIQLNPNGKILFFGGCAPYFDLFFKKNLAVKTCNIISDSLRLLNFFDIQPALLEDERCCGHDLLWSGDRDNFLKLAEFNVDQIRKLNIETVVTSCPECFHALSRDYREHGIDIDFEVVHLYDLIEDEIQKGAVNFKPIEKSFTFQDSCRLSRLDKRPELPRKLLHRLDSGRFREMKDHGRSAICCGNNAWTGCDSYSKALQLKRLKQARETGSELLITSCPKCQIHLKCAMEDPFYGNEIEMEMTDLTSIITKSIYWE